MTSVEQLLADSPRPPRGYHNVYVGDEHNGSVMVCCCTDEQHSHDDRAHLVTSHERGAHRS